MVSDSMNYKATQDRLNLYEWRVEAIDEKSGEQVYLAIFTGPWAMEQARECAAWLTKSTQPPRPPHR
jgi:hypothetical protein